MNLKREWFVYIIEAENGFLYTGITKDLDRRLSQHAKKTGAKFFNISAPKERLFNVGNLTHSAALRLESKLKKLTRSEKLEFLNNPQEQRLALTKKWSRKKSTRKKINLR